MDSSPKCTKTQAEMPVREESTGLSLLGDNGAHGAH